MSISEAGQQYYSQECSELFMDFALLTDNDPAWGCRDEECSSLFSIRQESQHKRMNIIYEQMRAKQCPYELMKADPPWQLKRLPFRCEHASLVVDRRYRRIRVEECREYNPPFSEFDKWRERNYGEKTAL